MRSCASRWREKRPSRSATPRCAIHERLRRGGKLIIFGNGGSATDANDFAIDCVLPPPGYQSDSRGFAFPRACQHHRHRQRRRHRSDFPAPIDRAGAPRRRCHRNFHQRRIAQHHHGAGRSAQAEYADRGAARLRRRRDQAQRLADFPVVVHCDYIPRIQEVQASIYHVIRESLQVLNHALEPGGIDPWPGLNSTGQLVVLTPAKCASGWSGSAASLSNTTSKPIPQPADACARSSGGQRTVPILVEDGKVVQVGWQGHGCLVDE